MQFDRAQLVVLGLSMYLTTQCGCNAAYHIARVRYANGARQYRLRCSACSRLCGGAILHNKIEPHMVTIDIDTIDPANKCERCGQWKNGVERHHWAPVAVFDDFYTWPTALLCADCHTEWHSKMIGYRWVTPTMRKSSSR